MVEAEIRLANRLTRPSGSLRVGASSWSVGSIWDKSGPPSFAHAQQELKRELRLGKPHEEGARRPKRELRLGKPREGCRAVAAQRRRRANP